MILERCLEGEAIAVAQFSRKASSSPSLTLGKGKRPGELWIENSTSSLGGKK